MPRSKSAAPAKEEVPSEIDLSPIIQRIAPNGTLDIGALAAFLHELETKVR